MPSRRDHVDAYRAARRRTLRALVLGRPDDAGDDLRRTQRTAVGAVALGALLTAVAVLVGFVRPHPDQDWRTGTGSVIVVAGSATRYVYLDGTVHPVLNAVSARLLLGSAGQTVHTVPAAELADVPRGALLGVPGAPDQVVPAGSLAPAAIAACAGPGGGNGGRTLVVVGHRATGGAGLSGTDGVLVATPADTRYLVTGGRRLRVADPAALVPLGLNQLAPVRVSTGWVDTVPRGPDLAFPALPGRAGDPVRAGVRVPAAAARVGQVSRFQATGSPEQWFVTVPAGLAPTSFTVAQLVLDDPRTHPAGTPAARPAALGAADVAAATPAAAFGPAGLPTGPVTAAAPTARARAGWLCLDWTPSGRTVGLAAGVPLPAGAVARSLSAPAGPAAADEVWVRPGSAALVAAADTAAPGPDLPASALSDVALVGEDGLREQLGAGALEALGYTDTRPARPPRELLDLLPGGPQLTPAAARQAWELPPGVSSTPAPSGSASGGP